MFPLSKSTISPRMWQPPPFTAPEEEACGEPHFSKNCFFAVAYRCQRMRLPLFPFSASAAIPSDRNSPKHPPSQTLLTIQSKVPTGRLRWAGDPACPECPSREDLPRYHPDLASPEAPMSFRPKGSRKSATVSSAPSGFANITEIFEPPLLLRSVRLARAVPNQEKLNFSTAANRHATGIFRRHGVVPGHLRRGRWRISWAFPPRPSMAYLILAAPIS